MAQIRRQGTSAIVLVAVLVSCGGKLADEGLRPGDGRGELPREAPSPRPSRPTPSAVPWTIARSIEEARAICDSAEYGPAIDVDDGTGQAFAEVIVRRWYVCEKKRSGDWPFAAGDGIELRADGTWRVLRLLDDASASFAVESGAGHEGVWFLKDEGGGQGGPPNVRILWTRTNGIDLYSTIRFEHSPSRMWIAHGTRQVDSWLVPIDLP